MNMVYICSHNCDKRAQRYCRFVYTNNKVPFSPHIHNPQFLDEEDVELGVRVLNRCDEMWFFGDKLTDAMEKELRFAINNSIPVRYFNEKCEETKNVCKT